MISPRQRSRNQVSRGPARILPVFLLALLASPASAQPDWFMAAAKDSFGFLEHKSASSILIYERRDVRIDRQGRARTNVRVARKLLATKGIADREGSLVESEAEEMKIRDIRGWRIDRSGESEELQDEQIARVAHPGLEEIFSHGGVVVAGFPNPNFGDIVGYEYEIENNEPYATYQRHSFQVQEPVRYSALSLTIPEGWQVRSFGWMLDGVRHEENGQTHTWTARDLGYRIEEPMMPPWSFLERELKVTAFDPEGVGEESLQRSDWPSVCRKGATLNDDAVERTPPIAAIAESLAAGEGTPLQKISAIGAWVQSRIRYVAVEVGPGRWEPHKASSVLANGYGDCKDKVVIFRSLLASIGIRSSAVLVNTESYVDSAVPSLFQFNHVIAAIADSGLGTERELESVRARGWIYFDPTDPAQPLGMLPPNLPGSRAVVLAAENGGMVRIPYGVPDTYRRLYRAEVTLAHPDTLRARIHIRDIGPLAHYRKYAEVVVPEKERLESIRGVYSTRFRSFEISDYSTASLNDTAWSEFVLTVPGAFRSSEGKFHLQPNLFPLHGILKLTSPVRRYPVWFGSPSMIEMEVVVNPGMGWTPDNAGSAVSDSCLDAVLLEYRVAISGKTVRLNSKFTSYGMLVDAEEYPDARKFSSSVQSFNDLTVTIKRDK